MSEPTFDMDDTASKDYDSDAMDKKAKQVKTPEELAAFVKEIIEYPHGYSSIVEGVYHAMRAAFMVIEHSPQGGITGFQAQFLGWKMIRWFFMTGDGPTYLRTLKDMLYPQYYNQYRTIGKKTWAYLQEEAVKLLKDSPNAVPTVRKHWESIQNGVVPFGYGVSDED